MTEDFYSKLETLQEDLFAHQENKGAKVQYRRNKYAAILNAPGAIAHHYSKSGKERRALTAKAKSSKLSEADKSELRALNKERATKLASGMVGSFLAGPLGTVAGHQVGRAIVSRNRRTGKSKRHLNHMKK